MRITLTGRRLALAAVLVLGGVAAPLAYATIGNASKVGNAPAQKPTRIVTPVVQAGKTATGAASAPTAVGDPYQVVFDRFSASSQQCEIITPPVGPFVLESVAVMSYSGVASSFNFGLRVKRSDPTSAGKYSWFDIPLDANGDGQQTFNLLVRPNLEENAAVGDIFSFPVCITMSDSVFYLIILTGKSAPASGPTPAQVSSFDATSGKGGATLNWKTASETEILGFNIWRYQGAKGVKVNRTLVRAKRSGEPKGASYRYIDQVRGAKRGLTYRLQLVDLKGKRTWYAAFAIASK